MTGMKDYFNDMMRNIKEIPKADVESPNFMECVEACICPFCHSEEFIIFLKNIPIGKAFYHFCPYCSKSWAVEYDRFTGEHCAGEIDLSDFLPDDPE